MYLEQKDPSELNALERRLLKIIESRSYTYFPISRALCLPVREKDEAVADKVVKSIPNFSHNIIIF